MKRLLKFLIVLVLILSCTFAATGGDISPEERKQAASQMATAARELGYPENHEIIMLAQLEWTNADKAIKARLEEERWAPKMAEYPVATKVWRFLKDKGYNDAVSAGILGNMMTEAGGQTLNLNVNAYNVQGFYGLCQWNMGYSEVWWTGLDEQLNFLEDSIEYEFNTFGSNYRKNFNYESFKNMTNEQDAALAFAKAYERCGSSCYSIRQQNASKALRYFTTF